MYIYKVGFGGLSQEMDNIIGKLIYKKMRNKSILALRACYFLATNQRAPESFILYFIFYFLYHVHDFMSFFFLFCFVCL